MASAQDMVHVKNISLYIPRIAHDSHKDSNFTTLDQYIAYKFQSLGIGIVENITLKGDLLIRMVGCITKDLYILKSGMILLLRATCKIESLTQNTMEIVVQS